MLTKKKLPYFFARKITKKIVSLTTEDVYHITKVLRLGCDDKLMIVNERKHYEALIMNQETNKLVIKVTKLVKQKEPLPFFTIVIGLFKLNHFE